MPERDPIIAGAPSVQTPQTYFHCNSAEFKKVYFSRTSAFVVALGSFSLNRSSASMSPESIYLTKTRKRAHEVTSVDSSTWKKTLEMLSFITWSFTSSNIPEMHLWIVGLSLERDIRLIFASLASPRGIFTVFNKLGFTSVSPIVSFFVWHGNFKCNFVMIPVFLVKTSGKMSLTFHLCSMPSEEF